MRSSSRLFYLAVFALLRGSHAGSVVEQGLPQQENARQKVLDADDLEGTTPSSAIIPSACAISPAATVSDACVSFSDLDALNDRIAPLVADLTTSTSFFSHYRLNLFNKECPFWTDNNAMCGNRACAVITLDSEDDIPAVWRAGELSKLEGPTAQHPGKRTQKERPRDSPLGGSLGEDVQERCVLDDDACERGGDDEQLAEAAESTLGTSYDRDYCVPEDDEEAAQWDYVSLVDNPERFTGYSGQGANHVWNAIYRENCYLKPASEEPQDAGAPLSDIRNAIESASARAAVSAAAANQPPSLDDGCYEKRVFHRLVSGMHASISAHLCWEFFDQKAGEWLPNVTCYKTRLHDYPERISNLYFNYALVSQAVAKLGESRALADYQYCAASGAGDIAAATADEQRTTRDKVHALTTAIRAQQQQQGPIFDASVMFRDDGDYALKDDFRARFRNVSRIMDCIGCDKCRLWGKLQTAGYGAALKVLLEFDEPGTAAATAPSAKDFPLRRTEVVALFNTLGRLSKSVDAVRRFEQALTTGDTDVLPSHVLMPLDPAQVAAAEQRSSEEASQLAAAAETLHATGPAGFLEKIRDEADDTPRYFGDEDVREQRQAATGSNPDMSVAEAFMDEFNAVCKAMKLVYESWTRAPRGFLEIITLELNRLWNYYLGLPVGPREWRAAFPGRDEL